MQLDSHTISAGQMFADRYLVEGVLGKGGMGAVYLARDTMIGDEVVALKVLHSDLAEDEKQTKRFLREVQLTRKITHPNVVRTFDAGYWNGFHFLTMELVKGVTLKEKLAAGPLPWEEVARIVVEVAKGLAVIHTADIVHRDLKPGNVMMGEDGALKIADFGVARPEMSDLTGHNEIVGSAGYMAPEVWIGKKIGLHADIYSLGIMAYEMLCGELPFDAESPAELMCKHMEANPFPPKDIVKDLPSWFNALILKMLAKDPINRQQSALEVVNVIEDNTKRDNSTSSTRLIVDPDLMNALKKAQAVTSSISIPRPNTEPQVLSGSAHRAPQSSSVSMPSERVKSPQYKSSRVSYLSKNARSVAVSQDSKPAVGSFAVRKVWHFIVASALSVPLLYVLHILGGDLVRPLWQGLSSSDSPAWATFVMVTSASLTAAIAGIPGLLLGVAGPRFSSSIRAWLKITLITFASGVGILFFNMLKVFFANDTLGGTIGSYKLRQLYLLSVDNMVQVAALSPVGSFSPTTGSEAIAMAPYFVLLLVFTVGLAHVVRNDVYGAESDRTPLVSPILFTGTALVCLVEYFAQPHVNQAFKWFSDRKHEVLLGGLTTSISEYTIACALINWFFLLLCVYLIIPVIATHKRDIN